jgi:hypothetical protein
VPKLAGQVGQQGDWVTKSTTLGGVVVQQGGVAVAGGCARHEMQKQGGSLAEQVGGRAKCVKCAVH